MLIDFRCSNKFPNSKLSSTISTATKFSFRNSSKINLQGTISTSSQNIHLKDPVTLSGVTGVSTGTGVGNITFDSTVDGTHNLTLNAGTGDVIFSQAVGGSQKLGVLDVTGANIKLGANLSTADSNIDFRGDVREPLPRSFK